MVKADNHFYEFGPCWSPDGKKIGFVSGRGGNFELYVMNLG
jgi:Tol biopolymer transport system component